MNEYPAEELKRTKELESQMYNIAQRVDSWALKNKLDFLGMMGLVSRKDVRELKKNISRLHRGLEHKESDDCREYGLIFGAIGTATSTPSLILDYVTRANIYLDYKSPLSPYIILGSIIGPTSAGLLFTSVIEGRGYWNYYRLEKNYQRLTEIGKRIKEQLESDKTKRLLSLSSEKLKEYLEGKISRLRKLFHAYPEYDDYTDLSKVPQKLREVLSLAEEGFKVWEEHRVLSRKINSYYSNLYKQYKIL